MMIKSRILRWAARMEEGRSDFKILTRKPTENIPLGRPTRMTILQWTLKKYQ